jgi:hypothetical protein
MKMESKICNKCKIEKLKTEFRILKNGRYYAYCNGCKRIMDKEYREGNKNKISESQRNWRSANKERKILMDKEYRERNKEKISQNKKEYRVKNHEKIKLRDKKYYSENIEKFKTYRENNKEKIKRESKIYREGNKLYFKEKWQEYYEKNKKSLNENGKKWKEINKVSVLEYRKKYTKERMESDLQFKLIVNHRKRVSAIFKELRISKKKPSKDILGVEIVLVINHIENQFQQGMSWENYGEWHIDHIIPLSSANNSNELEALFYYKNTKPMWEKENLMKANKYNEEDKKIYLDWYSKNVNLIRD